MPKGIFEEIKNNNNKVKKNYYEKLIDDRIELIKLLCVNKQFIELLETHSTIIEIERQQLISKGIEPIRGNEIERFKILVKDALYELGGK